MFNFVREINSTMVTILIICIVILLIIWRIWLSNPENIGKLGEKRVVQKLNWLSNEYITLNDVLLPTRYGTTQIDHIVVSPYGIFIIETKNYKGWIFGHEDSEEWTQSLIGKKRIWGWSSQQHKFRNPIRQNLAHFRAVRDLLKDVGEFTIIPIVAFSDRADLNITTPNHTVINWSNLRSLIKSYKTPTISPDNIQQIVSKLSAANITTEGSRELHNYQVKSIKENIDFALANHRCPKCGGYLVERKGKFGNFWGCSNYPNCRFTHKY